MGNSTQGWTAQGRDVFDANGELVASASDFYGEHAPLIAAAPDLLRALIDIRDSSAYCAASKARAAMALETTEGR
jgi:hypothetical protein